MLSITTVSTSIPMCWLYTASQGTSDVRLDPQLNKKVWESGIKGVPFRLRVRISRKRNDEEGAKEKLYSYVQAVNVKNPKGLSTVVVEESWVWKVRRVISKMEGKNHWDMVLKTW